MSNIEKINNLIKMVELNSEVTFKNLGICDAHLAVAPTNEQEEFNICTGIRCIDCIFRVNKTEENIKFLEELKQLASLNELIKPTK
jgi:hypothetical protein